MNRSKKMHHYFDTHEIVKRFIGSGIKEKQAEAIIKAIAESRDYDLSNLATKTDLLPLATRTELMQVNTELAEVKDKIMQLETSIMQVQADLSVQIAKTISRIEESKNEPLKWFIGVAIASIGTIVGLVALLLKYFVVK